MDSINHSIEFANVIIEDQNNTIVEGTITNMQGVFELRAKEGDCTLTISFLGYEDWNKEISVDQNIDLGIITLDESENDLGEVVVIAEKPIIERKVDRLVFNVENSISASGGDALDALRITPRVIVQYNQIAMIGKSEMKIMVDDRMIQLSGEDLTNFLQSIPSDNIKSIEVITNPPAKYDAEGNSGIINIKLKRAKKDSWNLALSSFYNQYVYPLGKITGRFTYQKNKLSFYSDIGYANGSVKRTVKDEIFYTDRDWELNSNKRIFRNPLTGKILIDYGITNHWTMGLQYHTSIRYPYSKEEHGRKITNHATGQIDSSTNTVRDDDYRGLNNLNLYSRIKFDTLGRKMDIDLTYLNYRSDDNRNFNDETLTEGSRKIKNYVATVDIEHPFEWMDLKYGFKISSINTINDLKTSDISLGFSEIDKKKSDFFEFNEKIQAVYLSGDKKINNQWEIKAGLRVENAQTEGYSQTIDENHKNNYTQLFPTLYLLYNLNDHHSLSFDYGRRIKRPSYHSLNPFKFYISEFAYNEGNPYLKPQFSNTFELQYGYKGKLYTSLSFTNETQGIGEIPIVNPDANVIEYHFTYLNYFTFNSIGISQSYRFKPVKWWEAYNSIDINYLESIFDDEIQLFNDEVQLDQLENTRGLGWYFSSNNSFSLNQSKTIKGELNFWYQGPANDLIYKLDSRYSLDIGLRFSILKDKNFQLNIVAHDIFKSNKIRYETFTNHIRQIYSYNDRQEIRVTASYSFGGRKVKYKNKKFGNEQEKNRTN